MDSLRRALGWVACLMLSAALGCASSRPPATSTPAAPQRMTAQPAAEMPGRRVSVLLDFESARDVVFIAADTSSGATIDARLARNGAASLATSPQTRSLIVKLPTLLEGRPFPADWTLLGGYLHCDQPLHVTLIYQASERVTITRTVALVAGAWTPVMIDLAPLGGSSGIATGEEIGTLKLTFTSPVGGSGGVVRVDDLMLIDNHETVVDTRASDPRDGWSVKRRGLNYVIAAPRRFSFAVPTAHAQQGGWSVAEASPARVRFASRASPRSMTIYADGRMYWGGKFQPAVATLADADALAAQHASPAELSVPESMGRVNRSAAGDADNDGYNEARGAYALVAGGSRLEVTITPRSAALVRPVLEIAGLPPGTPRVTMEGRLVSGAVRLNNGDLLVELPGRLQRPTLVNVTVQ